jgi:hypothetical protein
MVDPKKAIETVHQAWLGFINVPPGTLQLGFRDWILCYAPILFKPLCSWLEVFATLCNAAFSPSVKIWPLFNLPILLPTVAALLATAGSTTQATLAYLDAAKNTLVVSTDTQHACIER